MHKNTVDLTGKKIGNLTILKPTYLKTPKKRGTVWECLCDCGNICYKTGSDIRDKKRKTLSCGCQNKGGRKFPNVFVPKDDCLIETTVLKLSNRYSTNTLLTAIIMRNKDMSYQEASELAEKLNKSNKFLDKLIEEVNKEKEE